MTRETFIICDPHGCISELEDLLNKIKYDPSTIRLLIGGDILNRGPDSKAVVKLLRSLNAEGIQGNHDNRSVLWFYDDIKCKLAKEKNNTQLSSYKMSVIKSLDEDDLIWLGSLPLKINIANDWWLLHAGLENAVPFALQQDNTLLRCRYLDKHDRMVKTRDKLPDTEHWSKLWNQPFSIIAGHQVVEEPVIVKNKNNTVILMDTGCCFGNTLTGYFFERKQFVSVKAKKAYWKK